MKKLNAKGFTLIELLAVITIMGILMLVAIPTVSRTIENSRKATFLDVAKQYANGAYNMWISDGLSCDGVSSSGVDDGYYSIIVNSYKLAGSSNVPLLDKGGKSPWGNREIGGYVLVNVSGGKASFYPFITDGVHGVTYGAVWTKPSTGTDYFYKLSVDNLKKADALLRSDLVMSGANYPFETTKNNKGEVTSVDQDLILYINTNTSATLTPCVEQ